MANAKMDENSRNTIIGLSNTDGATITPIYAKNNRIQINDGVTGSDLTGISNAKMDENSRQTLTALASDGSGKIINLYVDSSNKLLTKST